MQFHFSLFIGVEFKFLVIEVLQFYFLVIEVLQFQILAIPSRSGPRSNGNEWVLHISQISKAGTSPSDSLV